MNPLRKITAALQFVANHPLNRNRKFRAIAEYGFIQLAAKLVPGDVCVEFPNHTHLLISARMKGAAHFISPRLNQFEDMAFVMHFLRANETFADVGANIGAFTVLASGVAGAKTVAFEPGPETFAVLTRNIGLNGLTDRVRLVNAVVGSRTGIIPFSGGLGTENHVVAGIGEESAITLPMTTLDHEFPANPATLMKVDVEGFETEVFAGAEKMLKNPTLEAIIVERNGPGNRYGYDEGKLHAHIRRQGFNPCYYLPFQRRMRPMPDEIFGNIIYIRDLKTANERLRTACAFELDGLKV